MVAVTKDTEDTFLGFKNACGYLKLQLYGTNVSIQSITLTGNDNEPIAGTATLTAAYSEDPAVAMASGNTSTSITLDCGEKGITIGASEAEATAFWIAVPPTKFASGFTITVTNTSGATFTKSTAKEFEIVRNVIKPMTAIEAEGLSIPTYHVETAGTLSTLISEEEKNSIASMKLTGYLNGDDISFIRAMADKWSGKLKFLDLSDSFIVEGGGHITALITHQMMSLENLCSLPVALARLFCPKV